MDDKSMSSIDLHQTTERTWTENSPKENICDLIHRCSNPTKHCDDHVWQCTVYTCDNGTLVVECIGDILGKRYSFAIIDNHLDPSLIRTQSLSNRFHHHLHHYPPAIEFDRNLVQYQRHQYSLQRNYLKPFVGSVKRRFSIET